MNFLKSSKANVILASRRLGKSKITKDAIVYQCVKSLSTIYGDFMLDQFKATARLFANRQNKPKWREIGLDFPFTDLQLQTLDTNEKRNAFLAEILKTAEAQANDTFENADEAMILFFAAYYFVYGRFMSNFRKPNYVDDVFPDYFPKLFNTPQNKDILFGLNETAKIIESSDAYYFCLKFANQTNGRNYILKPKEFDVETMLAKINAPFLIDEVGEAKRFMVFDGRRRGNEPRLFIFDRNCGHIQALKMENERHQSYEYDNNFLAYHRIVGTFDGLSTAERNLLIFSRKSPKSGEQEYLRVMWNVIDGYDSKTEDSLINCERFIFI